MGLGLFQCKNQALPVEKTAQRFYTAGRWLRACCSRGQPMYSIAVISKILFAQVLLALLL